MIWLRRKDIERVRNKLIGLFMAPGQCVKVAPPEGYLIKEVRLYSGIFPRFEYELDGSTHVFWLKVGKKTDKVGWHYEVDGEEPIALCFNNRLAAVPYKLIKAYAKHFPFVSSDNYFIHRGAFIA